MTAICFLDTNILLYTNDEQDDAKRQLSQRLVAALTEARACTVSLQVLNEYYNVAIGKPGQAKQRSIYRDNVRRLHGLCTAPLDLGVFETAWSLQDITNYAWWDLMIIASALKAGCRYLLTEDMMHGHELGELTIVNPFFADRTELFAKLGVDDQHRPFGDPWP